MKTNVLITASFLAVLTVTLSSCGGVEDASDPVRRVVPLPITGNSTPAPIPSEIDDNASITDIYGGASASFELQFSDADHDAQCREEGLSIAWELKGDAGQATLKNSTTCRPTIVLADIFSNDFKIVGTFVVQTKTIRQVFRMKKKAPLAAALAASKPIQWVDFAVDPANPLITMTSHAQANHWFESSYKNTLGQSSMRIHTTFSGDLQGLIWAANDSKRQRAFAVPFQITTEESEKHLTKASFTCRSLMGKSGVSMVTSCPFEFQPIDMTSPKVFFSFKKAEPANRASLGNRSDNFFYENVYATGLRSSFDVEIIMTLSHPHLKESVDVSLGSFPFWFHW